MITMLNDKTMITTISGCLQQWNDDCKDKGILMINGWQQ